MTARTLVFSGLVSLPAVLLAAIGLEARLQPEPVEWRGGIDVQHHRLASYGPIVRRTIKALRSDEPGPQPYVRLADAWMDAAKDGTLRPVYPSSSGDSIRSGVKAEIFNSRREVATRISAWAQRAAGDMDTAGEALLLSTRLCEVGKYMDFEAVALSGEDQIRNLTLLEQILPGISERCRLKLAAGIKGLLSGQRSLSPLLAICYRQYKESSLTPSHDGLEADTLDELRPAIVSTREPSVALAAITSAFEHATTPEAIGQLILFRLGFSIQRKVLAKLEHLARVLPKGPSAMLASR